MICAPMLHNGVGVLEWAAGLTAAARCEPCTRPCGICTLHERFGHCIGKLDGPAFGNLQNRAETLYKVKANHRDGHFCTGDKVAGKASAAEIIQSCLAPGCCVGHFPDVLICDIPPVLHYRIPILVGTLAAGIKAGCAGV